jgi:hypothetical protein
MECTWQMFDALALLRHTRSRMGHSEIGITKTCQVHHSGTQAQGDKALVLPFMAAMIIESTFRA